MVSVQKILVPIDFSPGSKAALNYALEFAKEFGGNIQVLHIVDSRGVSYVTYHGSMVSQLLESLEQEMQSLLSELDFQGVDVEAMVSERIGVPHLEIIDEAQKRGADLIVIGTHGHTGIAHAFLGSVAEKVVRHAPCPVLTVRLKEEISTAA